MVIRQQLAFNQKKIPKKAEIFSHNPKEGPEQHSRPQFSRRIYRPHTKTTSLQTFSSSSFTHQMQLPRILGPTFAVRAFGLASMSSRFDDQDTSIPSCHSSEDYNELRKLTFSAEDSNVSPLTSLACQRLTHPLFLYADSHPFYRYTQDIPADENAMLERKFRRSAAAVVELSGLRRHQVE